MIIFHEGLPGSGKSYEAMCKHIIPALQRGREVWSNLDGMDVDRIAQAAALSTERVRALLHQVAREDTASVHVWATANSFIVLDEAQNYWPAARKPLAPDLTQFVSEHRHQGIDILLMGQLLKDVHSLWKGRVDQLVVLNKLDAIGAEQRYRWDVRKATSPGKFSSVSSGVEKYDTRYFGTYKSHVDDGVQTGNYKDTRANMLRAGWVRWGAVAFVVLGCWGGYTAWGFFHRDGEKLAHQTGVAASPRPGGGVAGLSGPLPYGGTVALPVTPVAPKRGPRDPRADFVGALNDRYRPRLSLVWWRGGVAEGVIEWWDGSELRERLSFREIESLGQVVVMRGTVARVAGDWVTAWPLTHQDAPNTMAAPIQVKAPSL